MPQHDRRRNRRVAGVKRYDFALAGFGEPLRGTADEIGIAFALFERGAAPRLPAAGLKVKENLDRAADVGHAARDLEAHRADFGKPVALAPQLLQFLGAERIAQEIV